VVPVELLVATAHDVERVVVVAEQHVKAVLLDAPVDQALQRARLRNAGAATDRFESERVEFFQRVRAAYLSRAAAEPHRISVIDATQSAAAVAAEIITVLEGRAWIS